MFDNVTFGFGGGNTRSRGTEAQASAASSTFGNMTGANFVVDENFVPRLLENNMPGGNGDVLDLSYKGEPTGDRRPKNRIKRFLEDAWNNKWVQYGVMALAAVGLWRLWFGRPIVRQTPAKIINHFRN